MPDHIHVALRVRERGIDLSRVIAAIKSAIFQELRKILVDFEWQRGFHDRVVRENDDSSQIVQYVLQNPIRKGIVGSDGQYPFAGVVDLWF
jgi:putative transposase